MKFHEQSSNSSCHFFANEFQFKWHLLPCKRQSRVRVCGCSFELLYNGLEKRFSKLVWRKILINKENSFFYHFTKGQVRVSYCCFPLNWFGASSKSANNIVVSYSLLFLNPLEPCCYLHIQHFPLCLS